MIWQLRIVEGTKKRDNSMYNIIRANTVLKFLAMWMTFDTKLYYVNDTARKLLSEV